MSDKKKGVQVGSYLVSKQGKKYLKFENRKGQDSPFPITINEGDVLYLDFISDEFREKYGIPDFVKARIEKPSVTSQKDEDTF